VRDRAFVFEEAAVSGNRSAQLLPERNHSRTQRVRTNAFSMKKNLMKTAMADFILKSLRG
jgi:hypothetical protein